MFFAYKKKTNKQQVIVAITLLIHTKQKWTESQTFKTNK